VAGGLMSYGSDITDDAAGQPRLVLDAHHFLRDALFNEMTRLMAGFLRK
jgi:hypothetical protein